MIARTRTRLAGEAGTSLIELLVVCAMSVVVLVATLGAFDTFNSAAAANDRLTQAQDTARLQTDRIVRQLRDSVPVGAATAAIQVPTAGTTAVTSNDLVFGVVVDATTTGGTPTGRLQRYCVASGRLWSETVATAAPGAACPSTSAATAILGTVLNSSTAPLFSLDAARSTVGIDLRLDAQARRKTRVVELRTAARLRSTVGRSATLPPSSVTVTCSADKSTAILSLAGSVGGLFTVNGAAVSGSSIKVPVTAAGTAVTVAVTTASGLVQTLVSSITPSRCA